MDPSTIVATCRVVRQEVRDDLERHEGQEFTGANVSEHLGELSAQIDILAAMIGALARVMQEQ